FIWCTVSAAYNSSAVTPRRDRIAQILRLYPKRLLLDTPTLTHRVVAEQPTRRCTKPRTRRRGTATICNRLELETCGAFHAIGRSGMDAVDGQCRVSGDGIEADETFALLVPQGQPHRPPGSAHCERFDLTQRFNSAMCKRQVVVGNAWRRVMHMVIR